MDFSVEVIEPLLRNYLQTYPRHPVAFCQLADVFYARESYKTAGSFYATIIYMFELDMWDSNHVDEIVTDPVCYSFSVQPLDLLSDLDDLKAGSLSI